LRRAVGHWLGQGDDRELHRRAAGRVGGAGVWSWICPGRAPRRRPRARSIIPPMPLFVWINDQFLEESRASVSVRDTGLLHGAGVFTTMRSYGGKVFRLAEHLNRLRNSCEALFIPLQHN